jgi:hypothetical protein
MAQLSLPLKQRFHSFLSAQGLHPYAELNRNYEQILTLLQRRRNDDEFWKPLTQLLRDLVDSVVNSPEPNAHLRPETQLLALWDVDELARLLRVALAQEQPAEQERCQGNTGSRWTRLSGTLAPNAFGLCLLMSLATCACDSAPPPVDGSGGSTGFGGSSSHAGHTSTGGHANSGGAGSHTGGSTSGATACETDAATVENHTGYPLPVNCCADTGSELWDAIDQSLLDSSGKQKLYTCLANLNAAWCDGLVQIFQSASANEVANYLERMLSCCDTGRSSTFTGDFAQFRETLLHGMLCAVPLYKGVTFP